MEESSLTSLLARHWRQILGDAALMAVVTLGVVAVAVAMRHGGLVPLSLMTRVAVPPVIFNALLAATASLGSLWLAPHFFLEPDHESHEFVRFCGGIVAVLVLYRIGWAVTPGDTWLTLGIYLAWCLPGPLPLVYRSWQRHRCGEYDQ